MRVSAGDVIGVFEKLLSKQLSRSDASNWAASIRNAEDESGVEYEPPAMEDSIWKAVQFIEGFDLKDSPDSYLHNEEDLNRAFEKFNRSRESTR